MVVENPPGSHFVYCVVPQELCALTAERDALFKVSPPPPIGFLHAPVSLSLRFFRSVICVSALGLHPEPKKNTRVDCSSAGWRPASSYHSLDPSSSLSVSARGAFLLLFMFSLFFLQAFFQGAFQPAIFLIPQKPAPSSQPYGGSLRKHWCQKSCEKVEPHPYFWVRCKVLFLVME